MKIIRSKTYKGTTTDLFSTGKFYCSCKDFQGSQSVEQRCEHIREMILQMQSELENHQPGVKE